MCIGGKLSGSPEIYNEGKPEQSGVMFNLKSRKCLFPCLQRVKISKIEFKEKELVIKKAGGKYVGLEVAPGGNDEDKQEDLKFVWKGSE